MDKLQVQVAEYDVKNYNKFCNTEPLEILHQFKIYLDDLYYNTDTGNFPDKKYDKLKDILTNRDPNYIPPVGITIRNHENRAMLPYYMGSADKITPVESKKLDRWLDKNSCVDCVISSKLDGVSLSCIIKNGKIKLYTRGDGYEGGDISYLAQYLDSIPKNLKRDISVRGELIMKKSTFENKYKCKKINGRIYKNLRNMVSGITGGKKIRDGICDIDFVVYEILYDSQTSSRQSDQLKELKDIGFTIVNNKIVKKKDITIENLSKYHLEFKNDSIYEIDGIVVHANSKYLKNIDKYPKYMFAYKLGDQDDIVETTVRNIEWSVSKWGVLKPVVIYDPVNVQGVTMSRASGHHAKNIIESRLGIGATILVTRSKEVIPFIVSVVQGVNPCLPDVEYEWDFTKTNIKVIVIDSTSIIKMTASFFDKMNIKFISEATVRKLYDNGFTTLLKIIKATKEELMTTNTIKEKSAERIVTNIKKGLTNISLPVLLGASGSFGDSVGRQRVIGLFNGIPNILELYTQKNRNDLVAMISKIEGFSDIIAMKIVKNLPIAIVFSNNVSKYVTYKKDVKILQDKSISIKKFVMSGFRDIELEDGIVNFGGELSNSVSKNTTALIVKSIDCKETTKIKKANELKVPIYNREDFIRIFLTNK
jgi:DNA ligase (NAD+)